MRLQIGFVLILSLFATSCSLFRSSYTTIAIEDYRETPRPAAWPDGEAPGTVKVYREVLVNPIYTVHLFRKEDGRMRQYSASYGSAEDFTQAGYLWKNDSTVVVRLLNPERGPQVRFTVWGNNGSTGIRTTRRP